MGHIKKNAIFEKDARNWPIKIAAMALRGTRQNPLFFRNKRQCLMFVYIA